MLVFEQLHHSYIISFYDTLDYSEDILLPNEHNI